MQAIFTWVHAAFGMLQVLVCICLINSSGGWSWFLRKIASVYRYKWRHFSKPIVTKKKKGVQIHLLMCAIVIIAHN